MAINIRHDGSPGGMSAAAFATGQGKRRAEDARQASAELSRAILQDEQIRSRAAFAQNQNRIAEQNRDAAWKREDERRSIARKQEVSDRAEAWRRADELRTEALDREDRIRDEARSQQLADRRAANLRDDQLRLEARRARADEYAQRRADIISDREAASQVENDRFAARQRAADLGNSQKERDKYFSTYFERRHTPEQVEMIQQIQDELEAARSSGRYTREELADLEEQAEDKIYSIQPQLVYRGEQPLDRGEQDSATQQEERLSRSDFEKRFDATYSALKRVDENGVSINPTTDEVLNAMRERDYAYDRYRGGGMADRQQELGLEQQQDKPTETHETPAAQVARTIAGDTGQEQHGAPSTDANASVAQPVSQKADYSDRGVAEVVYDQNWYDESQENRNAVEMAKKILERRPDLHPPVEGGYYYIPINGRLIPNVYKNFVIQGDNGIPVIDESMVQKYANEVASEAGTEFNSDEYFAALMIELENLLKNNGNDLR